MGTESIAETQVDLFADELPGMEKLKHLSGLVHSSEAEVIKFTEKVEQNMSKTGGKGCLASGIGLYILGRDTEAVEKLTKGDDSSEKYIYLGYALRRLGRFDEGIESLRQSRNFGADTLNVTLAIVETYRMAKDLEAAEKELKTCTNFENVSAEYHYQLARLQEAQGLYGQAMDNYKAALELSPNHQRALFHLAFRCDLSGDEDAAIDYYKQITHISPVHVSSLMNLAILYEDREEYDKAEKCIDAVLAGHPNHQKAMMFKKDIESSMTMVYDEEKERRKDRKTKILEMPISDFELSVRSRNCLRKMNINTLGDLLHTTETELLAYKNFGETSLREIKTILEPRNLYLGMALEEQRPASEISEEAGLENADTGILSKSVDDLQLSVRSRKCLQRLNIRNLGEIISKTDAEMLACKNFGVTSLNEIKKELGKYGLLLRKLE